MITEQLVWLALAGLGAGALNALAGAGTLLTFPALLAMGIAPVTANGTNTVGLLGGGASATWAGRLALRSERRRAVVWSAAGAAGGLVGALLVVALPDQVFAAVVPFLILLAVASYLLRKPLRRWVGRPSPRAATALVGVVGGGYSGYFGAGAGIPILAITSSVVDDVPTAVALKNLVGVIANVAAAVVFVAATEVNWAAAGVLLVSSTLGGWVGGALVGRVPSPALTVVVVLLGVLAATVAWTSTW